MTDMKKTRPTGVSLSALQQVVDINPDPALVCDPLGIILRFNEMALSLFQMDAITLDGAPLEQFVPHLLDFKESGGFVTAVRLGELDEDHRVLDRNGKEQLVWFSTSRLKGPEDDTYYILVTMRNVTDRSRLEAELREMSYTDELTGLCNRRFLKMMLPFEEERSRRYGYLLACTFVDMDDFKSINDTYGHYVGDRVLEHVALELKDAVRKVDIVCRWGGDEFVIMSLGKTVEGVEIFAERLQSRVSGKWLKVEGNDIPIHITCGAAVGHC